MAKIKDVTLQGVQRLSFWDRIYIPAILKGLWLTIKHFLKLRKFTIQYPDERWVPYPHYRGLHRLTRDTKGRVKCVACYMCATACPAKCITIEAGASPWPDREKYPIAFEIDELRCIYCRFCEEACPEDAIELTEIYDYSSYTREEMILDKEKLLAIWDLTYCRKLYGQNPGTVAKASQQLIPEPRTLNPVR